MANRHDNLSTASRVIVVGAITNVFLAITKVTAGTLGNSHALVADGIHSASDLFTDLIVYFAAKYGGQAADDDHPYGHRKIETVATTVISVSLVLVGIGIMYDAFTSLAETADMQNGYLLLIVSFFSIVANEWLFRYTAHYAKKLKLELLMANAWHHRSDAASSVVVFIGIAASILGHPYLDAIAAVIVALMIIKTALKIGWTSVQELIDTSIDQELLDSISQCILSVEGVQSLHQLRGRSMAADILLDVHVLVSPKLTVSEGHYIGQQVRLKVCKDYPEVIDMTVHIDPEDDEFSKDSSMLKTRSEIVKDLQQVSANLPLFAKINRYNLHYLEGSITLEIYFPQGIGIDSSLLANKYKDELASLSYIKEIVIYLG